MSLILGSNSPRRKEILGYFAVPFSIASPPFDESSVLFQGDPELYAGHLAEGKALSLQARFPSKPILTADTLVFREGKVFLKPVDEDDAQRTLAALCGGWHTVYTAVCAAVNGHLTTKVEATRVLLINLTPLQIRLYHQTLHCADKAGAYAIQGAGSLIVRRIEGCYYNVVGLPVQATAEVLKAVGVDLWGYLKPF